MNKNIFLTTTLPYINSKPHIGHAFEFIIGDALFRALSHNNNVHFNIGLDEHGQKVYDAAISKDLTVEQHIEEMRTYWYSFCDVLQISYTTFYKTFTDKHYSEVKNIWVKLQDDIYKKSYTGKYCQGCESFKLDKDLINGKCLDHPNTIIKKVQEENYFFRLKKYKEEILNWLDSSEAGEIFLTPSSKKVELINLLKDTEDISISRSVESCKWGIKVPGDESQVIYVWFEALLNYIIAAGYNTNNLNWENVIQICGPDNLRFQGIIFQSFLSALGLKHTDRLIVHGTIVDSYGKKISKSVGNTIDPIEQVNKYGINAFRYYCLAGLNPTTNVAWKEDDLVSLWNSNICNDFGNTISRVLHLIDIKIGGNVSSDVLDSEILDPCHKLYLESLSCWENLDYRAALENASKIVKLISLYISDKKPWELQDPTVELSTIYLILFYCNRLYSPVFPDKSKEIEQKLKEKKKVIIFERLIKVNE